MNAYPINDLFHDVESRQEASVAFMQTYVPCAEQPETRFEESCGPERLIVDHPQCFYPGCTKEREYYYRARYSDGRLLTCEEHRGQKHYYQVGLAKKAWVRT